MAGIGLNRFQLLRALFYSSNYFCAPAALIRRSAIEQVGYRKSHYLQLGDMEHWTRLLFHGELRITPEPVIRYRIRANHANLSDGRNAAARARSVYEHSKLLKLFVENIKTAELLLMIFPELNSSQYPLSEDLIPFHLAQAARFSKTRSGAIFAIDLLHDMLSNETIATRLQHSCDFDTADLFKLEADLLDFLDCRAQSQLTSLRQEVTNLQDANKNLEAQLIGLQEQIAAMSGTKIWKLAALTSKISRKLSLHTNYH